MSDVAFVTGLAALQTALDTLPVKIEKNILRGAMRAGAKVQLAEARRAVPVETSGPHPGALRASLRITTSARNGVVKASVKAGGKKAFWAAFVEFGTAAHLIKPKNGGSLLLGGNNVESVRHPGAKKHPFMRPALDNTFRPAVDAAADYIRRRLTKEGIETPEPGA